MFVSIALIAERPSALSSRPAILPGAGAVFSIRARPWHRPSRYQRYRGHNHSERNYGVLVLSSSAAPRWVRLGPADAIEKNIGLYRHFIRNPNPGEALVALLRELHDQLWQPLSEALPIGTKKLIISPDGELDFVSFATLLKPNQEFLGQHYSISYVSSGRDLLSESQQTARSSDFLVWANPDFGTGAAEPSHVTPVQVATRGAGIGAFRDLSLRPLPGAEKEGEMLRTNSAAFGLSQAVLHLGKEATEAELNRVHAPYILHLATHGFVLPDSGLANPAGGESEFLTSGFTPRAANPMRRSGLALAGAQRTLDAWARGETVPPENDGIVTAEEIGTLNLRNTWLVVLSACDTGMGEARFGEGVLGLRRGFIQAGAQNLLMTLWPIDDEQTVNIIGDFYAAAAKSRNAAQALAEVQRTWLVKLRKEKGIAEACRIAGPFILSSRGPLVSGLDRATAGAQRESSGPRPIPRSQRAQ